MKAKRTTNAYLKAVAKMEGYKFGHAHEPNLSGNLYPHVKPLKEKYFFKPRKRAKVDFGSLTSRSPTLIEAFKSGIPWPICDRFIALKNQAKRLSCLFDSPGLLLKAYMRTKDISSLSQLELMLSLNGC